MSLRRLVSGFFAFTIGGMMVAGSCSAATITRGNVGDIDSTGNSSSTISASYDSGSSGTDRYSVFVVQSLGNTDTVTSLMYGGTTGTLLTKYQSQNAQGGNYNYIYGLANPATSTNTIDVTATQTIAAEVLAVTYDNVDPSQPDIVGSGTTGTQLSTWTSTFDTTYLHEVGVVASADINGNMQAGDNATKLSTTRASGSGYQVWEVGEYANNGSHSFTLNGSNGGAMDVAYVMLKPTDATSTTPADIIVRGASSDFDDTANSSSTITELYDSGSTGTSRYAVISVQLSNTTDVVTSVTYGSSTATLLKKRQASSSGSNTYSYLYGVSEPSEGSNPIEIHGSQSIAGRIAAITYSNVSTTGPDVKGSAGLDESADAWSGSIKSGYPGEVIVFQSSDAQGGMGPGKDVTKLSTVRSSSAHDQVWDTENYVSGGYNTFGLVGANGGGIDVSYVSLFPIDIHEIDSGIVRRTTLDFENESTTATSILRSYDSGMDTASDRYTIVTVQLPGTEDVVTNVSYGGISGKLLFKRKSTYSQGGNYNYMFGIVNSPTGTHTLAINATDEIPGLVTAVTYTGVDASQPQLMAGAGYNTSMSSLTVGFETRAPGTLGIMMSSDNNGSMSALASTQKLSTTRSAGSGYQVWQCGAYENVGGNACHLNGSNGGTADVAYVLLTPAP